MLLRYLSVVIGGAVGGILRYLLSVGTHSWTKGDSFPFITLLINLLGCLLLGTLYAVAESRAVNQVLLSGMTIGVLGSFTTFSTFCLQSTNLIASHPFLAVIYVIASMLGGPFLVWLGGKSTLIWLGAPRQTTEEWTA